MISSSNSTWSCLCFYFSRSLPRKHWTQRCAPRLPDFLQNQSQIKAKLNSFPKWVMCVSMVQKNMKESISSVRFGHLFMLKRWSDFFLELYLLLPLDLPLKKAPKETFEHRNVVSKLPNVLQNYRKWLQNTTFFQSGESVFYIVNTMLFFPLAALKCDQKH